MGRTEDRERVTVVLGVASFERTPLLEISVKAAAIEALGWTEYARLPQRWIVKYEKVVAGFGTDSDTDELANVLGEFWVPPSEIPPEDLATAEEIETRR